MLTGRQIREARGLLALTPSKLATRSKVVTTMTVNRAEANNHHPPIADFHMKAIRQTLENLGIEFTANGARLRQGHP